MFTAPLIDSNICGCSWVGQSQRNLILVYLNKCSRLLRLTLIFVFLNISGKSLIAESCKELSNVTTKLENIDNKSMFSSDNGSLSLGRGKKFRHYYPEYQTTFNITNEIEQSLGTSHRLENLEKVFIKKIQKIAINQFEMEFKKTNGWVPLELRKPKIQDGTVYKDKSDKEGNCNTLEQIFNEPSLPEYTRQDLKAKTKVIVDKENMKMESVVSQNMFKPTIKSILFKENKDNVITLRATLKAKVVMQNQKIIKIM